MEYLVVLSEEDQEVNIDGYPLGRTNTVCELEAGTHAISLKSPSDDFTPDEITVDLRNTSAISPKKVYFFKKKNQMPQNVFVSSTFVDLENHRNAVQRAIKQLGAVDISMENFGARDQRPKQECLRIISEECGTFVGIYAHRYGFVPKGEDKSITEAEYHAAGHLPRFIYLINEDVPWKPSLIDTGKLGNKLKKFKELLQDSHICKYFSNKDELATSVAADLGRHFLRTSLVNVQDEFSERTSKDNASTDWSVDNWNDHRYAKYNSNKDLFLVHSLSPSSKKGQLFDIFIYIQRHKSQDLSDIKFADFFLGPYWNNRIFTVHNKGKAIGIKASAHGEFLAVCRITMKDGSMIFLDRYVNFAEYARQ